MPSKASYRRELADLVKKRGGILDQTTGNHFMVRMAGCPPIYCSSSPRNPSRTLANVEAMLRRFKRQAAQVPES